MSRCHQVARPMARCLKQGFSVQTSAPSIFTTSTRFFANSASRRDPEPTTTSSSATTATDSQATQDLVHANANAATTPNPMKEQWMDPNTTTLFWAERKILKQGKYPIGSRRRRAAVRQTPDIPFEKLPYHCFQEARKLLAEDRVEKLEMIKAEHQRLKRVEAMPTETYRGGARFKEKRLDSLRRHIEYLKIQADINDPLVKKKFEDGLADMTKPIYRYFAEQRWRTMAYKILAQRVEQFHVVPDILPRFDPKMDVQLTFRNFRVQPGEIVDSLISETPPNLRVQVFDNKERLVSIVVMDSDVPDPNNDSFGRRLHFMAANIPISCLTKNISLNTISKNKENQLAVPWLPPFSQEGAPYHRLTVWILEQEGGEKLDIEKLREHYVKHRDGFRLHDFRAKYPTQPFGFNIFRTVWDEHTAKVMEKHAIPGAELVFRRKRVRSLKGPKKARGWEAKRQGPKYKHLWKYTKRIGPMSGGR